MPIMDNELLFGEGIDLGSTSAGLSVDGTNVVYMPKVKDHLGSSVNQRPNESGRLYLNATVENEAVKGSGGAALITARLYAHTGASSIASSGDQVVEVLLTSVDASGTNYPDGKELFSIPLPAGKEKPYLGVNFAVATKKVTQGKVTCWIGPPIHMP